MSRPVYEYEDPNHPANKITTALGRPPLDLRNTETAFKYKNDGSLRHTARMFNLMNKRWLVDLGSKLGLRAVQWNLPFAKTITRATIFRQFVGGRTLRESSQVIEHLYKHGVLSILDYGSEGNTSEAGLNETLSEFMRSLEYAATQPSAEVIAVKITGLARFALLERIQQEGKVANELRAEYDRVRERLEKLCRTAQQFGVRIFIDAEESWIQETIDDLTVDLMERYNRETALIYNTYQMYRHDRLAVLKKHHERARLKGYLLGVKLVRGAYMDKERARAAEMGYADPIQPNKEATDRDFDAAIHYCVEHYLTIGLCNGSHNEKSTYLMARLIDEKNISRNHPHLMFCQLYGMSDNLTFNLAAAGYVAAKYIPYGSVKEVVPYLVRRAQENSSVTGEMGRELKLVREELKRRGM